MLVLADADEYVKAFDVFRDSRTPALREAFRVVSRVAQSPRAVLIYGETGTGKEVVARALHELSATQDDKRYGRNRPFVAINCATFPPDLVDAELFGHVKGAFTGASAARDGVFKRADGGTLFLDEIGEFPLTSQAKLLRVLDTFEVTPVGGITGQKVETRVIAATNRNLEKEVSEGRFRQDLFHRLAAIKVTLPPLRDRTAEEILDIARYYVRQNTLPGERKNLSAKAESRITAYPWPGNVRELENTVARAVLMSEGEEIREEDLGIELSSDPDSENTGSDLLLQQAHEVIRRIIASRLSEIKATGKQGENLKSDFLMKAAMHALRVCDMNPERASRVGGFPLEQMQEITGNFNAGKARVNKREERAVNAPLSSYGISAPAALN